jgi:uncharacterized damage-inducible protein DinB
MSSTSNRLLRHMAWANQSIFSAVQALEPASLASYIANPEWTAAKLLHHIVDGAEWYVYCLTGSQWQNWLEPKSSEDIETLKKRLVDLDAIILKQDELEDEPLLIVEGEKSWKSLRSTIISEAIYHAIEHRAQLLDALEARGYTSIKLDDYDLWRFEVDEG